MEDDERQDHVPFFVCLERASQDIVRYLPDKVRFFSEVVWGHGEVPVMEMEEIMALIIDEKESLQPIYYAILKRKTLKLLCPKWLLKNNGTEWCYEWIPPREVKN